VANCEISTLSTDMMVGNIQLVILESFLMTKNLKYFVIAG